LLQEAKNNKAVIIGKSDFIKELLGLVDILNVTDIALKGYQKKAKGVLKHINTFRLNKFSSLVKNVSIRNV
jgi:hypothetical protein